MRSLSETATVSSEDSFLSHRKRSEVEPLSIGRFNRTNYADLKPSTSSPRKSRIEEPVQYTSIQLGGANVTDSPSRDKRWSLQRLERVDENEGIYDVPNCEPTYSEVRDSNRSNPELPPLSTTGHRSSIAQSSLSIYTVGSDPKERDEDFEDLPPIPDRDYSKRTQGRLSLVKEPVRSQIRDDSRGRGRSRLHSVGDVLECNTSLSGMVPKVRGSVDNLARAGKTGNGGYDCSYDARGDLLSKLHEQDELLSKILARSRNERNEELTDNREDAYNRAYKYTSEDDMDTEAHLYASPTNSTYIRSGRSSSSSDRGVERVLTKVASDTARGYAYKIQIPFSNREYDVPRRTAPPPDLTNHRSDGPPKPLRYITSAES